MSGKEKIYFLLGCLQDIRVTSPSGQPLKIDPMNDLYGEYDKDELTRLFTKLEQDEHVLKVLKTPSGTKTIDFVEGLDPYEQVPEQDDGFWHIELLQPAFDEYLLKTQDEPEYKEFSSKKLLPTQNETTSAIKPNRKALEKIWNVLQEIEEKRQLATDGEEIRIPKYDYTPNSSNDEEFYESRKSILPKLVSLNAIKDLKEGEEGAYMFWSFRIGDNYHEVFADYEKRYKETANEYEQTKQKQEAQTTDVVYEITFLPTREILLNKVLQVAKPDFESENEVVFSFLYEHPNETYTQKELEVELKRPINKSLHKIVENLGFEGDLKRVFFDVSKDSICFKNPVTKQDLDRMGITRIKLPR